MISLHKDMIYQCMKLNKKKIIEKRRPKNPFVQRQKGDRFCLVPQFSGCSVQLPTIHSIQFEEFNKHRKHQMFRLNCMFFTTAHALNWSTQNGWILFVLVVVFFLSQGKPVLSWNVLTFVKVFQLPLRHFVSYLNQRLPPLECISYPYNSIELIYFATRCQTNPIQKLPP